MAEPFDELVAMAEEFGQFLPSQELEEGEDDLLAAFDNEEGPLELANDSTLEEEEDDEDEMEEEDKEFVRPKLSELYTGMDQTDICAVSTEKGFGSLWKFWWNYSKEDPKFAGDPWVPGHGLQLYNERLDVKNHLDYNQERVDKFFEYLRDSRIKKSRIGVAKTFLNTNIKCEHHWRANERGVYVSPVQISVGISLAVKRKVGEVQRLAASRALEECEDLQSDLEVLIPCPKIREMSLAIFEPKKGGAFAKLAMTNRLIFAAQFHLLMAIARRGEEIHKQRIIQRCVGQLDEVGAFGVSASKIVTNKAKHNQSGWLEFTMTLPHMDPLRDQAAWHGMLLLWRKLVDGELYPSFLDESKEGREALFGKHCYPAAKDRSKPIESDQVSTNFTAGFSDANIHCKKNTHQGRLQASQEMDIVGLPESVQQRMTAHKGKGQTVHQKSYVNNPPTLGLVQRAGGDPFELASFDPVQFMLSPEERALVEEVAAGLVPDFFDEQKKVGDLFDGAKSHAELKSRRLVTRRGTLDGLIRDISQCVVMLASPLTDPKTFQLSSDTRSRWCRYNSEALAPLLQLPPFKLPSFTRLSQSILAKLCSRGDYSDALLSHKSQCAMERFMSRVARPFAHGHQENRLVVTELQQQHQVHQREKEALHREKEDLYRQLLSGGNGLAAPFAGASNASPSPARMPQPPTAVVTPPAPVEIIDDSQEPSTLADGTTPRKRRRPITQLDAISREVKLRQASGDDTMEEIGIFNDMDCNSARDYWNKYNRKWKGMFLADVGETRNRSQWITKRSGIWRLIEHHMTVLKETEEEAIEKAELVYASIKTGVRTRWPHVPKVTKAFKAELSRLGINFTGRPKGSKTKRTSNRKSSAANGPFVGVQVGGQSHQDYLDRIRAEDEDRHNNLVAGIERQINEQREHNEDCVWQHVYRHQRGPAPPRPTNYRNLHPPPMRPPPGYPMPILPPGHHYYNLPP